MALSVTVERHMTQVSWDSSLVDAAVLPMRRSWCWSGGPWMRGWMMGVEWIAQTHLKSREVSRLPAERKPLSIHQLRLPT
jgi:hypothetical protein